MNFEFSERLQKLPPYLFVEIDRAKKKALAKGVDIISLGIGDPDLPTPPNVIEKLYEGAQDQRNHQYAMDEGMPEFRKAIADWYNDRFGVILDAGTEVLPLIGSKEGIGHIHLGFVNPGDVVLVPEPGYPVYQSGTWFAEGKPVYMPLVSSNSFLPDFSQLNENDLKKARLLFLNYPNNPTGAVCDLSFFEEVVDFARKHDIIVCHDAAYTEMYYDDEKPHSFLEVSGAKDVGIEFHSLSKTYNMTGWRIGFAVGNSTVLDGLRKVKSNLDSGIFQAIQVAGVEALTGPQDYYQNMLTMYQDRRDVFVDGLNSLGWNVKKPKATFYIWIPVPPGYTSAELVMLLLEQAGIVTTPGNGFGTSGEGYIRAALTVPTERIKEALGRIKKLQDDGVLKV